MSFPISQIKEHLVGMGHGGTLNKVRNVEAMFERSIARASLKVKFLDSMRKVPLVGTIHDDFYNYPLADDFGGIVDLSPSDERELWDKAFRNPAGQFDLEKALRNKTISIESQNGRKFVRINWRSRQGKTLNSVNSLTGNGTWSAVGSATNLVTDTINKYSGAGSVRFDTVLTGDGIQNTTMSPVSLTDESLVADIFVAVYLSTDFAHLTSIGAVFGNDLTTKYWTPTAVTTQADGSAFQFGWNIIKFSWETAVQTGVVAPATIDSFKLFFNTSGTLKNVRVDNIVFSIGRAFDMKYYSKYLITDATTGVWKSRFSSEDDLLMVDNDSLPLMLMELLIDMAQQMEGTDSAFDINFAMSQLKELYPAYKGMYPNMIKKSIGKSTSLPRIRRGFFGRR